MNRVVIIGGGPAGRIAAVHLGTAGEDVLLIDRKGATGGQCLHHGCMVICALNDIARTLAHSEKLTTYEIFDASPKVSLKNIWREIREIQKTISDILDEETTGTGVTLCTGKEACINGQDVTLDGEKVSYDKLIISTGSRPYIPDIQGTGLAGVYTPHNIHNLTELPEKISVIGGGVIASEFAYIFSALGSEVEMLCRRELFGSMDETFVKSARKELEKVSVRENTPVDKITENRQGAEGLTLHAGHTESRTDAVLIATGLVPNTDMISGFEKGKQGEIIVNRDMQTGIAGIYAAGDVTGPPYLTPVARREGLIAAGSILGRENPGMPSCIPQSVKLRFDHSFCSVPGIKPDKAYILPSPAGAGSFWSVPERYTGYSKIELDTKSGKIVRMYAGSPGSSLFTPYMAYLMERRTTTEELKQFPEVHPAADGIYGLIRYAQALREEKKREDETGAGTNVLL
ncbi:MAG: NAD(P)/FAD-dependent oxidoreductase [Euryarchaeota archaeon]|nr:NAD(P)/FAD-dependent oxidoreductase [Euryarchaeota archaeon]